MSKNKNKNAKNPLSSSQSTIHVNLGTTPKEIVAVQRALAHKRGVSKLSNIIHQSIFFDHELNVPERINNFLDEDIDTADLFSVDELVKAVLPADTESLLKAEAEGRLSRLLEDWALEPGAACENMGAGGSPCVGFAIASTNEKRLKNKFWKCVYKIASHERQGQLVLAGFESENKTLRQSVECTYSALGGMGPGAFSYITGWLKGNSLRNRLPTRITSNIKLRGNLPVKEEDKANTNQTNLLKELRARSTGMYEDTITGEIVKSPFDRLYLQSNKNNHGCIDSLEGFICHEGHCQDKMHNSVLSRRYRERMVDIESWDFDENGDPQPGFSASVGYIRRGAEKIIKFGAHRLASMFAKTLTSEADSAEIKQKALSLVHLHGVVETEDDSNITGSVLAPKEFKGESLIQHMRSQVSDRTEGTTGLEYANVLAETFTGITTDLSSSYEPAMSGQAGRIYQQAAEQLDSFILQKLSAQIDFSKAESGHLILLPILLRYRQIIEASYQIIVDKISQIDEFSRPHLEILNAAMEELDQVRNRSWWWWLFRPFLAGKIASTIESSGRVYLECQMQLLACRVSARDVLEHLMGFLDGKINELRILNQALKHVFASCKQKAEGYASKPALFDTPVGIDMVNSGYLNNISSQTIAHNGGRENVMKDLLSVFLSKYGSLGFLIGKEPDEIEAVFVELCQSVFKSVVNQTDVVAEFIRLYPQENQQVRLLSELIVQTESRVHTPGQNNKEVIRIKFVTVPAQRYFNWMKELISKADSKGGEWEIVVDNDSDAITVFQVRNRISLSSLIAEHDRPDNAKGWKQMVKRAVDPVAVTIVPPNPSDGQVRRVFAKALANKQLFYDPATGFCLKFSGSNPIRLGKEPDSAAETLRSHWRWIVRIESGFGHKIVVDDIAVSKRIEQLKSLRSDNDRCCSLIDDNAVSELEQQLAILLPRLQRLRINFRKQED